MNAFLYEKETYCEMEENYMMPANNENGLYAQLKDLRINILNKSCIK